MRISPTKSIKLSQKESLFLQEISVLLHETALDDPRLQGVTIHRVALSPDGSTATVFFHTPQGEEHFKHVLETLKLYKPSLRKALATRVNARYMPQLVFRYDHLFKKQERLEQLFEKIKEEKHE